MHPLPAPILDILADIGRASNSHTMSRPSFHSEDSILAEAITGHKLGSTVSPEDVKKVAHVVIEEQRKAKAARKEATRSKRIAVLSVAFVFLAFLSSLVAMICGFQITRDTKHEHKSDTQSGTQALMTTDDDLITVGLTHFQQSEDKLCGLFLTVPSSCTDPVDDIVSDITVAYQADAAHVVLNMKIGSIEYMTPDDPDDMEATISEITSISGRFSVLLQQGGEVVVVKDEKRFATERACDVPDHEERTARRRLMAYEDWCFWC